MQSLHRPFLAPARRFREKSRGSALLVALLFSAIIAISIVSYLRLSSSSLTLSNRTFYNTVSLNLAETGAEEALWSFNQVTDGVALATAWSGWNISDGITAKRTYTDFGLQGNVSAAVKVYVDHYDPPSGTTPKLVVQSTITIPNSSVTLSKWLEVSLRRRSKFAMGLVAKNQITFNGNVASVDSWNSLYNDDGTARGSFVDYAAAYKHSSGSVGSTSVGVGSVAINNADIWGYASVGSTSASAVSVGANGTIASYASPAGTVDTTRIATDFTTNFDTETATSTGTWIVGSFPATIGTAGTTSTYLYSGTITSSFTVQGNVTLVCTASSGDAIRLNGGSDTLTIAANSSLNLYAAADVVLTGGGVANATNQASSFIIHGTGTSGQDIEVGGGAYFKGCVYAPNAAVKIHGNPDVMGSIVGNTITVVGNAKFHYDESLANYGGTNPWGIVKWRELTSSDARSDYTSAMSGW